MKKPLAIILVLATLSGFATAAPTLVADWRLLNAKTDAASGVVIPDRLGNGYDITIPSGAKIENDSSTPGGKALTLDGSIKEPIKISVNMVELANLHVVMRFKPASACVSQYDLISSGRWRIRYNGTKRTVQLYLWQISSEKVAPRAVLEFKAKPDEWNIMVADVFADHVEARMNDCDALLTASSLAVRFAPIENGPVHLFRSVENGTFIGSIADFSIGYTAPGAK